ncbi:MAG: hypothetical protein HY289_15835 [Planctomycetes bacterium]|nr:hypothetical protein [Planctomycetota bacterium]
MTIISNDNWHLSALTSLLVGKRAIESGGAFQSLLLHTTDTLDEALNCQHFLQDRVACKPKSFSTDDGGKQLRAYVRAFIESVPDDQVAYDLKPGTKKITWWIVRRARTNNGILNLETKFEGGPRPGYEKPEVWQVE